MLSKPTTPLADDVAEEEYPADDDYAQYDDDDDNKSSQTNKEDNSVHIPPYFETSEYKKMAKVGEDVVLECRVKNLAGKDGFLIGFLYPGNRSLSKDDTLSFPLST